MSNHYIDDPTVIDVEVEDGGSVAGTRFTPGSTLILDDYDVLHVNVIDRVEKGNPLPVSGGAVLASIDKALGPWLQKVEGEKNAFLEEAGNKLQQVTAQTNTTLAEAKAELAADKNAFLADAGNKLQQVTAQTNTTLAEAKAELAADKNAFLADAGDALEEIREVVQDHECAPPIVCEARGETILVQDSAERLLHGLILYGKTTQEGTPTPENPVELVSPGDDGSVGVTVAGKNLIPFPYAQGTRTSNGLTCTVHNDGSITVKGTPALNDQFILMDTNTWAGHGFSSSKQYCVSVSKAMPDGVRFGFTGTASPANITSGSTKAVFQLNALDEVRLRLLINAGTTVDYTFYPQLEEGTTATSYEPYAAQTLTASTPNGLPGIPVTSGGNYTDESGQEWVCDEVDFARGKYVQRVNRVTADTVLASGKYSISTSAGIPCIDIMRSYNLGVDSKVLCNCYVQIDTSVMGTHGTFKNWQKQITIYDARFTSLEQATSLLREADFIMLLRLATPIETDLSAEELAQYAALHTNKPTTTVWNDAGAGMGVAYVADTKTYIDNKLAAISAAMLHA